MCVKKKQNKTIGRSSLSQRGKDNAQTTVNVFVLSCNFHSLTKQRKSEQGRAFQNAFVVSLQVVLFMLGRGQSQHTVSHFPVNYMSAWENA